MAKNPKVNRRVGKAVKRVTRLLLRSTQHVLTPHCRSIQAVRLSARCKVIAVKISRAYFKISSDFSIDPADFGCEVMVKIHSRFS